MSNHIEGNVYLIYGPDNGLFYLERRDPGNWALSQQDFTNPDDARRAYKANEIVWDLACPDDDGPDPILAGGAPSLDQLRAWQFDDGCEATDGCWVEHDGTCPHGAQSWLLELGMI